MIVADTGAIVALIDRDDEHHERMVELYESTSDTWVLPWAILPEVDYIVSNHVGAAAQRAFVRDLAVGAYAIEWGNDKDLSRAHELCERYRGLQLGLTDSVVMAVAERLRAPDIATLDLRHFGAVAIKGKPRLLPRDA